MRQDLGYFVAIDPDGAERIVTASQYITTDDKNVIIAARKVFTVDGDEVIYCDNQRAFTKKNDQVLKIVGNSISSEGVFLRKNKRK
jgi:hypothetical protein